MNDLVTLLLSAGPVIHGILIICVLVFVAGIVFAFVWQGRELSVGPFKIGATSDKSGESDIRPDLPPILSLESGASDSSPIRQKVVEHAGMATLEPMVPRMLRVINVSDGENLLICEGVTGQHVEKAWQFTTNFQGWAVFGPYRLCLGPRTYKATFRVKIADLRIDRLDRPVVALDVCSRWPAYGQKTLAHRSCTARDFSRADEYEEFALRFEVKSQESDLETRLFSFPSDDTVTLDYVELLKEA